MIDKNRAPKKTDLDRLNDLIDWYEANKPNAGARIEVDIGPKKFAKMLGREPTIIDKEAVREYAYRGITVVAIGFDPK